MRDDQDSSMLRDTTQNEPPEKGDLLQKHEYHRYLSTVDKEDSAMRDNQDSSMLRGTTQNEPQVFDVANSPPPARKSGRVTKPNPAKKREFYLVMK